MRSLPAPHRDCDAVLIRKDSIVTNWSELRAAALPQTERTVVPPTIRLPVLPTALNRFLERSADPNVSFAELGTIVETDAGLTTDLLRHVNSSAMGLRRKTSAPHQAISILGLRDTRLFLSTTAVDRSMRTTQSKLINIRAFCATNLERAVFARQVARLLKVDAELAFAAGMLQDCLLPALSNELYEPYLEFLGRSPHSMRRLVEFELERYGWTHAEAAAAVMRNWGFPDDLVCCVALHHRGLSLLTDPDFGRTSAAAVAVAALMPCALRQVPDGMDELQRLEQAWPAFRLDGISRQVEAEYQQLAPGQSNPFSFRRAVENLLPRPGDAARSETATATRKPAIAGTSRSRQCAPGR